MQKRSSIIGGLILISIGLFFLALDAFPELGNWIDLSRQWPLIIVGGGLLFLLGAFMGTPPLAVPGAIVTGIGSILYYQNLTDNWASWSYVWTLIPGFVGIGLILLGLLDSAERENLAHGVRLLVVSLVLFTVFGLLMSGFGGLWRFWPLILIGIGGWLVWQNRQASGKK